MPKGSNGPPAGTLTTWPSGASPTNGTLLIDTTPSGSCPLAGSNVARWANGSLGASIAGAASRWADDLSSPHATTMLASTSKRTFLMPRLYTRPCRGTDPRSRNGGTQLAINRVRPPLNGVPTILGHVQHSIRLWI